MKREVFLLDTILCDAKKVATLVEDYLLCLLVMWFGQKCLENKNHLHCCGACSVIWLLFLIGHLLLFLTVAWCVVQGRPKKKHHKLDTRLRVSLLGPVYTMDHEVGP